MAPGSGDSRSRPGRAQSPPGARWPGSLSIGPIGVGHAARVRDGLGCSCRTVEPLLQQRPDQLGIGLTAGGLHYLPDEEAERWLAGAVVGDRRRIRRQDGIDGRSQGAPVADLAEALRLDDLTDGPTTGEMLSQHLPGIRARELSVPDAAEEVGQLACVGPADQAFGSPLA